ncbi:hypothetical protein MKY15_12125 [Sporosarcina sp. FSL K6-1540]|uniref:hypothetical protein n=1 Tax=Sporosarcina TaxID=1569 RepID=UPI00078B95E2|nr:hypothetical protein [Sporosarcina psychrophila]AMQ05277.1 hypothetical protein AZE41_04625 [Sporosarcina psychrophila]
MSDRFELSFKNKVVRMWLIIMVPAVIAEILIMQFTAIPVLPSISWTIFFIWLYFYKRKQKKEHSISS